MAHGCFWHRHDNCPLARTPKARQEFWVPKLEANQKRDERALLDLKELGWRVLAVWECQLRNMDETRERLRDFLDQPSTFHSSGQVRE